MLTPALTAQQSQVGASTSTGDHAPVQASVDADPVPRAALSKQAVRGVPVARPATPLAAAVDLSGDLARLATATSRLDVALSRGFDAVVQARSALADCSVSWHYTFNEVRRWWPLLLPAACRHSCMRALALRACVSDHCGARRCQTTARWWCWAMSTWTLCLCTSLCETRSAAGWKCWCKRPRTPPTPGCAAHAAGKLRSALARC